MIELPPRYRVLPHSIPFTVPGFEEQIGPHVRTLAPEPVDCEQWFERFLARIESAVGREYLPICRISDGEFTFLLGHQPPSPRESPIRRAKLWGKWLGVKIKNALGGGFRADTAAGVSSGQYSREEWETMRSLYGRQIAEISRRGLLALHLGYTVRPFQECFFPSFARFLKARDMVLSFHNYCPFYFVYAMLVGPERHRFLKGRRVLVVHSAEGERRKRIMESLKREGVDSIEWLTISGNKSLFDQLDLSAVPRVDLTLIGAGVGKPNILLQLAPLAVPCIDAGYIFEVWDNPENALRRPMSATDEGLRRLKTVESQI